MSTTLPEVEHEPPTPEDSQNHSQEKPPLPDASVLEDRLPEWFRGTPAVPLFAFLLGMLYMVLNFLPLMHTDLWGHLTYGRYIWETGGIPSTEPLMPMYEGVKFVDTAWLSQLIGFGMISALGTTSLKFLYAISITLSLALLTRRLFSRTASVGWTIIGCGVFLAATVQQLGIVRPQLAGVLCYVALFCVLTSAQWRKANWVIVPVLFALWANLHGSFLMGLGLIGLFLLGRVIDVSLRTGSVRALVRDHKVRRYLLLLELGAVAVMLNPYGMGIYPEVLSIANNPNVKYLLDWSPMTLLMLQGKIVAFLGVGMIFLYHHTPRRIIATELLLLLGLGACMLWTSRMILWWAPVAAYYTALHGHAVWRKVRKKPLDLEPGFRESKWTVITIGLIWICFGFTPFGVRVRQGAQADESRHLSTQTPIRIAMHLNEHPPEGMVFNSMEWGDFLMWAGPKEMQLFVNSHAHLVPHQIWIHYLKIIEMRSRWSEYLDRYGVNTIVIDHANHPRLISQLKNDDDIWRVSYEDERGIIFVRRQPI